MTIALATAANNPIANFTRSMSPQMHARCLQSHADYPLVRALRAGPSGRYNCHGMTFASRRTGIWNAATVQQILIDDGYRSVPVRSVIGGDIIIYHAKSGDIEHSGVVLEPPVPDHLNMPLVCSKWGMSGEMIHWAHYCPYETDFIRYYRIS